MCTLFTLRERHVCQVYEVGFTSKYGLERHLLTNRHQALASILRPDVTDNTPNSSISENLFSFASCSENITESSSYEPPLCTQPEEVITIPCHVLGVSNP